MSNVSMFAYDVETTGLDSNVDEIVSLAWYTLDEKLDTIEKGCFYAHPSVPEKMNPRAQAVNKYTYESWEAKGACAQHELRDRVVSTWVAEGVKGAQPMGHNAAQFDQRFLIALVGDQTRTEYLGYHCEDSMVTARFLDRARGITGGKYSLITLCARYGIDLPEDRAHDAFNDVTATVALYRKLIEIVRGDMPVPEPIRESFFVKTGEELSFRNGKHKGKALGDSTVPADYLRWVMREIKLSDEERALVVTAGRAKVGVKG